MMIKDGAVLKLVMQQECFLLICITWNIMNSEWEAGEGSGVCNGSKTNKKGGGRGNKKKTQNTINQQ